MLVADREERRFLESALMKSFRYPVIVCAVLSLAAVGQAQTPAPSPSPQPSTSSEFRLRLEMKTHARFSRDVQPGQSQVFERTVDEGSSLELSNLAVSGEGRLSSGVSAKLELHFLDLYNRNPTSSDDRVFVREAWLRLGPKQEWFEPLEGTNAYLQFGMAPRFTRITARPLESYGLWSTAVGRFEQMQLQFGGSIGSRVYWRAQVGNGNPLFFRDPNALAGDNGPPERVPGNVRPAYQSGFPILYDTKAPDLNVRGRFEWGAGLGYRRAGAEAGPSDLEVLAWYFRRSLADEARIRGTFYGGDLDLLRGVAFPLPFVGRDRSELGLNFGARSDRWRLVGQLVRQDIAQLVRRGFEIEGSVLFGLPEALQVDETPIANWIRPVIRVSFIDNQFTAPFEFPAPSVAWDWLKWDIGARLGLLRDVDLTLEYARNSARTGTETLHPDEVLLTLRVGVRP
jgi:hypothetical protein